MCLSYTQLVRLIILVSRGSLWERGAQAWLRRGCWVLMLNFSSVPFLQLLAFVMAAIVSIALTAK